TLARKRLSDTSNCFSMRPIDEQGVLSDGRPHSRHFHQLVRIRKDYQIFDREIAHDPGMSVGQRFDMHPRNLTANSPHRQAVPSPSSSTTARKNARCTGRAVTNATSIPLTVHWSPLPPDR